MEDLSKIVHHLQETNYGEFTGWSNGKIKIEFFPEGFLALQKELATGLHSPLYEILQSLEDDVDIRLAAIAKYCSVVLDGTYTIEERDKLCYILAGRLEVLRQI